MLSSAESGNYVNGCTAAEVRFEENKTVGLRLECTRGSRSLKFINKLPRLYSCFCCSACNVN